MTPESVCSLTSAAPKYYDAFPADGVGDLKPIIIPTALVLTPDTIAGDISTGASIAVGGSVVSTIDMIGDQDFFQVELVAGRTPMTSANIRSSGGPSGVPLTDAYIELYDAAGNLVTTADGGGPNTPSGLDALLTFVAAGKRHLLHQRPRLRPGRHQRHDRRRGRRL